jgi:hypothetical protein
MEGLLNGAAPLDRDARRSRCRARPPLLRDGGLSRLLREPGQKAFWGGYAGTFADPDGHIWEVAHNPFFPLDEAGNVTLP